MAESINYHSFSSSFSNLDRATPRKSQNGKSPSTCRIRVGDLGTVELLNDGGDNPGHQDMCDDEDDASSIDENYDVVSLASSIEDQLT